MGGAGYVKTFATRLESVQLFANKYVFPHPKGTLLDLRAPGLAGQVRQTVEAREFLDASPDDPIHPNMVPLNE